MNECKIDPWRVWIYGGIAWIVASIATTGWLKPAALLVGIFYLFVGNERKKYE